jgi:hypothetical protein
MVNLQGMPETDLEKLEADFKRLREQERREHGALKPSSPQPSSPQNRIDAADNG